MTVKKQWNSANDDANPAQQGESEWHNRETKLRETAASAVWVGTPHWSQETSYTIVNRWSNMALGAASSTRRLRGWLWGPGTLFSASPVTFLVLYCESGGPHLPTALICGAWRPAAHDPMENEWNPLCFTCQVPPWPLLETITTGSTLWFYEAWAYVCCGPCPKYCFCLSSPKRSLTLKVLGSWGLRACLPGLSALLLGV
jgi:hypothetical protein